MNIHSIREGEVYGKEIDIQFYLDTNEQIS